MTTTDDIFGDSVPCGRTEVAGAALVAGRSGAMTIDRLSRRRERETGTMRN